MQLCVTAWAKFKEQSNLKSITFYVGEKLFAGINNLAHVNMVTLNDKSVFTAICEAYGVAAYKCYYSYTDSFKNVNGALIYFQPDPPGYYLWGTDLWESVQKVIRGLTYNIQNGGLVLKPDFYSENRCKHLW